MKKLQRLQTTNLFYNRYVYRLWIKNDVGAIFRGMNLGTAKAKIDEMQSFAEAGQRIPFPFRFFRDKDKFLSLETFMDAYTIYSALEKNVDKCMVRVENFTLDLYSNDNDWLEDLAQKIYAVSITEPADDESLNFLLENVLHEFE